MTEPIGRPMSAYEQHVRKWLDSHGVPGARAFFAAANGTELELSMLDIIGQSFWTGGGISSKWVKQQLDANPDVTVIRVLLDSPGGSVFDGVAIHNLLKRNKARVEVEVLGEASSAASVIAMAGDVIKMHEGSAMMIHRASSCMCGFADDFRTMADALDTITGSITDIYETRTGRGRADIDAMVKKETWMSARDAVKEGFADEVVKAGSKPAPKKPAASNAGRFIVNINGTPIEVDLVTQTGRPAEQQLELPTINATAPAAVSPDVPTASNKTTAPTGAPPKQETDTMTIAITLLAAIGLSSTATESDAIAAIGKLKDRDTLAGKFEQTTGKTGEEAVGVALAWKSSHEKLPEVQKELATIKTESDKRELEQLLNQGRDEKKLTKAESDNLKAQVESGAISLAAAKSFVAVMSPKEHLAASPEASKPTPGPAALCWNGKSYEALSFGERHELSVADEKLFEQMRADWQKRGEPKTPAAKSAV
jgi:ATP-dependent Clp protease, protease subunit